MFYTVSMKKILFISLSTLFLIVIFGCAGTGGQISEDKLIEAEVQPEPETEAETPPEESAEKTETAPSVPPDAYTAITQKCMDGDDIDFNKLRLAYAESEYYSPYGAVVSGQIDELISSGSFEDACYLVSDNIYNYLGDLEFLYYAFIAFNKIGDENAGFFQYVFWGIIESIDNSGDGLSYETAFHVVSVREEYIYMSMHDIIHGGQSLQDDSGHLYDVFEVMPNPEAEVEFAGENIYFNIDLVMGYLSDLF